MNEQTPDTQQLPVDENSLIAERRAKLTALRGQGIAYPNDFRRADYAGDLQAQYADGELWTAESLDAALEAELVRPWQRELLIPLMLTQLC